MVAERNKPRILLVDDIEAARYATARVLRANGFDVLEAASGEEALEKSLEKPDLIVLDVNMPDISGFDVCKRLKSDPATRSIPVLHLSATYKNTQAKVSGLEGGADGYLTQPVDPKELTATINALLRLKKAEEAAERQARQWQATFDAANDAIWVLDGEQRILQSNRTAELLFGRSCQEMIGRRCWEIVHGTTEPIPECPFLRGKQSFDRESMELPLGDRWFEVTVDPILDGEGSYAGAVHIVSDITARRRAEEQIRFLARALDHYVIAAYHDRDLNVVWANKAYQETTGLSLEEIKGRKCYSVWNLSKPCRGCPVITAIETGEKASYELTPDNQDHWPETQGSWLSEAAPVRDERGAVIGAIEFAVNITERKQQEARIVHLNRVLRAIRDVNQLITREKDRDALLRRSCEILISTRGYRSAWVALRGEDGTAQTVAECGIGDDFAPVREALARGDWPDCYRQAWERPDGIAMIHDTVRNCTTCSLTHAYRDTAALAGALRHGGRDYGVLVVALPKGLADDPEEQSLFLELVGDVAYALYAMEQEQERKQAETKLAEQLHELQRWHDVMMDREDRVIELKKEVNELLARTGEPPRYPSAAGGSEG
jgi:PAS domain S-box-containing protein